MIVGTSIFEMDGTPYYSPEFARGGLAATFVADITQMVGSPTFTIAVEHRNAEDTSFTALGSFSGASSVATIDVDLTGCKEILRFKYSFDAADDSTDGVHFLMQRPTWRPY